MIIYIHGFGSSGRGQKATLFRDAFSTNLIAPSLPISPDLAIDSLKQLIESFLKYEEVFLVGSSLGGFYGQYLSQMYDLKLAAINPVIKPEILSKHVATQKLFYDQTIYEYTHAHFEQLPNYKEVADSKNIFLLLQEDDETIDYKEALEVYKDSKQVVTTGGGHAFEGIENYFEAIKKFFN